MFLVFQCKNITVSTALLCVCFHKHCTCICGAVLLSSVLQGGQRRCGATERCSWNLPGLSSVQGHLSK